MAGKLWTMLTGFCQITIPDRYKINVYNILRDLDLNYWDMQNSSEQITFFMEKRDIKSFLRVSKNEEIPVSISSPFGVPKLFGKYKKRYGIYVGIAAALAILWVSHFFVWDIRITGNERVSDEEIIELLDQLDFHIGTYIPSVHFQLLQNEFLLNSDEIVWMAVNLTGTVANVEVREKSGKGNMIKTENAPANMIASCSGEIVLAEVFEGVSVVGPGDIVKEGDLLISGMIDSDKIGIRYEQADGKVLAKVSKYITVKIPLSNEKKVYTGRSLKNISINFFSKEINIFTNSGNYSTTYDKIIRKQQITFGNTLTLPIYITEEFLNAYRMESVEFDAVYAAELAQRELQKKITDALQDAELLQKEITSTLTEEAYIIECELYCLQNIAISSPFEIQYTMNASKK